MKKPSEILAAGWTQGTSARDTGGHVTCATNRNAVSFCILGAIVRGLDQDRFRSFNQAVEDILGIGQDGVQINIAAYNDAPERTKDECVNVLRKAEALCQERYGWWTSADWMSRISD